MKTDFANNNHLDCIGFSAQFTVVFSLPLYGVLENTEVYTEAFSANLTVSSR